MMTPRPNLRRLATGGLLLWSLVLLASAILVSVLGAKTFEAKAVFGQAAGINIIFVLGSLLSTSQWGHRMLLATSSVHAMCTGLVGAAVMGGVGKGVGLVAVSVASLRVLDTALQGHRVTWGAAAFVVVTLTILAVIDGELPNKPLPLWVHAVLSAAATLVVPYSRQVASSLDTNILPLSELKLSAVDPPRQAFISENAAQPTPRSFEIKKVPPSEPDEVHRMSPLNIQHSIANFDNTGSRLLGVFQAHDENNSIVAIEIRNDEAESLAVRAPAMQQEMIASLLTPHFKFRSDQVESIAMDNVEDGAAKENEECPEPFCGGDSSTEAEKPGEGKSPKSHEGNHNVSTTSQHKTTPSARTDTSKETCRECNSSPTATKFCPETGKPHNTFLSANNDDCKYCSSPSTRYCPQTGLLHFPSGPASPSPRKIAFTPDTDYGATVPRSRVRANSVGSLQYLRTIQKTLNWKKGDLIGTGGFGKVHIGLNLETGELMAVKNVQFSLDDKNVITKVRQLQNEIEIMKPLHHPHIVKYFYTEKVGNSINIFMEYVPGGSLQKLLSTFGPLNETTVVQYTYQILAGLKYLHEMSVIHRDIKGANILLTVEGYIKLADFGASVIVKERVGRRKDSLQGTPFWMAPEVVSQQGHGWEADIWSLGCTVMEMLTAKHPWEHLKLSQLGTLQYIIDDEQAISIPKNISRASKMFMLDCLDRKPANRPSAKQLIEHHYFLEDAEAISKQVAVASGEPETPMTAKGSAFHSAPTSPLSVSGGCDFLLQPRVVQASPAVTPDRTNEGAQDESGSNRSSPKRIATRPVLLERKSVSSDYSPRSRHAAPPLSPVLVSPRGAFGALNRQAVDDIISDGNHCPLITSPDPLRRYLAGQASSIRSVKHESFRLASRDMGRHKAHGGASSPSSRRISNLSDVSALSVGEDAMSVSDRRSSNERSERRRSSDKTRSGTSETDGMAQHHEVRAEHRRGSSEHHLPIQPAINHWRKVEGELRKNDSMLRQSLLTSVVSERSFVVKDGTSRAFSPSLDKMQSDAFAEHADIHDKVRNSWRSPQFGDMNLPSEPNSPLDLGQKQWVTLHDIPEPVLPPKQQSPPGPMARSAPFPVL